MKTTANDQWRIASRTWMTDLSLRSATLVLISHEYKKWALTECEMSTSMSCSTVLLEIPCITTPQKQKTKLHPNLLAIPSFFFTYTTL